MLSNEEYQNLLKETKKEFPNFEILQKRESNLMTAIDVFLKIITLGNLRTFMSGFITTIGQKVYVPRGWDLYPPSSKAKIIRHEKIHMKQAEKYGRLLFSLLYIFLPFPVGVAYFRKKFEQEAYEESLKALYEYNGEKSLTPKLRQETIDHFTTAQYFWMWPWKKDIEEWYDSVVEKIKKNR